MDNKRLLAVHESGHILLAHLFPQFDWHAFSHLLPGGSVSVSPPHMFSLRNGDSFCICVWRNTMKFLDYH